MRNNNDSEVKYGILALLTGFTLYLILTGLLAL